MEKLYKLGFLMIWKAFGRLEGLFVKRLKDDDGIIGVITH